MKEIQISGRFVREIPNMWPNTRAYVEKDHDGHNQLHFQIGDVFHMNLNVDWCPKESDVDWLAQVLGGRLKDAINHGYKIAHQEVRDAFHPFLGLFDKDKNRGRLMDLVQ